MTESWRATLLRLDRISQTRELTEREQLLWNEANRKKAREQSRKKTDKRLFRW